MTTSLEEIIHRQRQWSRTTFGPGRRTLGIIKHIQKELQEIEADPTDVEEWVDVMILAMDGAWRSGACPEQIVHTLREKQSKNRKRQWPDWRTFSENDPSEHVK